MLDCKKPNSSPVCDAINRRSIYGGRFPLTSAFSLEQAQMRNYGYSSCAPGTYALCMTAGW